MRKLWLRAESAVARVELREGRSGDLVDQSEVELTAATGEALIVLDGGHHACRGLDGLVAPVFPYLGHGEQNAAESGTAVSVVAREIGATEVGTAIGCE